MIADAAGVSEALLYRHFKGKEELHEELQQSCIKATVAGAERLSQLEPSTQTLVLAIYFMVRQIIRTCEPGQPGVSLKRLMLGSLMGDGEFARGFLKANFVRFLPKLVACLEAARRAGDLDDKPHRPELRLWLAHHAAVMASNVLLPEPPVVDYGVDLDTLVEETARFALRGLGLNEPAIARHYAPKALGAFLGDVVEEGKQAVTNKGDSRK
jgi:AcrR family transcriptional regulator